MNQDKVMLLIDADNVSIDVVEQAVAWVGRHFGGPHVRRAYCTAESAVKHQGAFKRLGIRPMVNLAAGKNSTDIALAVDAIDLALAERPDVMVIASSDSDFAPLVGRLREKGCKVVGVGQRGKTGDETRMVYDDFEVMDHRKAGARGSAATDAGRSARKGRTGRGSLGEDRAEAPAPPEVAPPPPSQPEPPTEARAEPKPARRARGRRGGSAAAQGAPTPTPAPAAVSTPPAAPAAAAPDAPGAEPRRPRRRRSSRSKAGRGEGSVGTEPGEPQA